MLVLGGTHGREMNNGLYLLDTITMTWTKLESNSKKNMKQDPDTSIVYGTGKVFQSEESEHREWSTVVDISMTSPSFKLVPLSLPRSSLSKTPKQVFF